MFSFGMVMWELLTGEEPYADLHYGAIIGNVLFNSSRPHSRIVLDPIRNQYSKQIPYDAPNPAGSLMV